MCTHWLAVAQPIVNSVLRYGHSQYPFVYVVSAKKLEQKQRFPNAKMKPMNHFFDLCRKSYIFNYQLVAMMSRKLGG